MATFTFTGTTRIKINKEAADGPLKLHAKNLTIQSVFLRDESKTPLSFSIDLEHETCVVTLPADIANEIQLSLEFSGEIKQALAGLYQTKYQLGEEAKIGAVTQFFENDARQMFPCFDEPHFKAVFHVEVIVDRALDVVFNTDPKSVNNIEDDKKHIIFEPTPVMSTYLLFLGVADWDMIETTYKDKQVRLFAHPDKAQKYGHFSLNFALKCLEYSEDYYNIEYPLPKLDLVAAQSVHFGAMENWGAILFRENALLNIPNVTSKAEQLQIMVTVAHEIAHQWFGNLVSPANWKFIWLNESFATYFGYGVADHYYPEYSVWENFVDQTLRGGLNADSYVETVPIELPGDSLLAFTVKSIPIIYNKGGSVIRQLEAYIGKEAFKDGLRHYLNKFQYGVASSDDLWLSLQETSGQPITDLMKSWLLQEGHPMVHAVSKNGMLNLSQRRFTFMKYEDDTVWQIPLTMKFYKEDGSFVWQNYMFSTVEDSVDLPAGTIAFKLNSEATGFYRVLYDQTNLQRLGELAKEHKLSIIDRWHLLLDSYDLVKSLSFDITMYLDFLKYYERESHYLPMKLIGVSLNFFRSLIQGELKDTLFESGKTQLGSILSRINMQPQEGEDRTISILRGDILTYAAAFKDSKVIDFLANRYLIYKDTKHVEPEIRSAVLQVGSNYYQDYNWIKSSIQTASSESEKASLITALGSIEQEDLVDKLLSLTFDFIPMQHQARYIDSLTKNKIVRPHTWLWYMANLDNFEKTHPGIYQAALLYIISTSYEYESEIVSFFADYLEKNPQVKETVEKAIESMKFRLQIINHYK